PAISERHRTSYATPITVNSHTTPTQHRAPTSASLFNTTTTPEIHTLSLHDALPIYLRELPDRFADAAGGESEPDRSDPGRRRTADRKSTRLNSSHVKISYAVFCLKKKKRTKNKSKPTQTWTNSTKSRDHQTAHSPPR